MKIKSFSITNFLSFKEKTTFYFKPSGHHLYTITGLNASGKSNLLKAFILLNQVVQNSWEDAELIEDIFHPFLLAGETIHQAGYFEIVTLTENKSEYRYGFSLQKNKVVAEWLYHTLHSEAEVCIFKRQNQSISPAQFQHLSPLIPTHGLLLGLESLHLLSPKAWEIYRYISYQIIVIPNTNNSNVADRSFTYHSLKNPEYETDILEFLQLTNPAIQKVHTAEIISSGGGIPMDGSISDAPFNYNSVLVSKEANNLEQENLVVLKYLQTSKTTKPRNVLFNLDTESANGTQKIFSLSALLSYALKKGALLIMDHPDAQLHPTVLQKVMHLVAQSKKAQLLFTTYFPNHYLHHNSLNSKHIIEIKKDKYGASSISNKEA